MTDRLNKTSICSIVFLDIIDHSKKAVSEQIDDKTLFNVLINEAIKNVAQNDRIILDTGDGAAITLMGAPEEALFVALTIRDGVLEHNKTAETPLLVRIGINLGSVRVVKDINDRPNIIGDGINVAQRIMSFASENQILVSRSYYEVTARLTKEITSMFLYFGVKQDKHVREHEVYSIVPKEDVLTTTELLTTSGANKATDKANLRQQKYQNGHAKTVTFTLPSFNFASIKESTQAYFQQLKLVTKWLPLISYRALTQRFKPVQLLIASSILLLIIVLLWFKLFYDKDRINLNASKILVESEILNPETNVNPVETNLSVKALPTYQAEKMGVERLTVEPKRKAQLPNTITPKPRALEEKKELVTQGSPQVEPTKNLDKKTKPKYIGPVLHPTTKIEEVKAEPIVNKIVCSQAQIAMQQCRQ